MRPILAALALVGALCLVPALARDGSQWDGQPDEARAWYRNAELTEAAQGRFPFKKCCDKSDVVRTKFQVNRTTAGDEWFYQDVPGHWKRVPADIIHWGESAPGGQPTLFVYSGQETCFFPGSGGI